MNVRHTDGRPVSVLNLPDGRTYVDPKPLRDDRGKLIHRGGPECSPHYHRWEEYSLEPPLKRCHKCGLLENYDQPN